MKSATIMLKLSMTLKTSSVTKFRKSVSISAPAKNKKGQTVVKKIVIITCVSLGAVLFVLTLVIDSPKSLEPQSASLIEGSTGTITKPIATAAKNAPQPAQPPTELFVPASKEYEENWCSLEELTPAGSIIAFKEAFDFDKAHGIFDTGAEWPAAAEMYDTYDSQTLRALGENGDLLALTTLFYNSADNKDLKKWAANTSFLFGATWLTYDVASEDYGNAISKSILSGGAADVKEEIIDAMALAEFAALRGSIRAIKLVNSRVVANEESGRGVSLNDTEFAQVKERAQQIYNNFNRQRAERSLPPFDDSIPKLKLQENEYIISDALSRGKVTDWASQYMPRTECTERLIKQDEIFIKEYQQMLTTDG